MSHMVRSCPWVNTALSGAKVLYEGLLWAKMSREGK